MFHISYIFVYNFFYNNGYKYECADRLPLDKQGNPTQVIDARLVHTDPLMSCIKSIQTLSGSTY